MRKGVQRLYRFS